MRPSVFGDGKKYLKADEVKSGDLIKITDEGMETISTKFTYPDKTMAGTPHPRAGQFKPQFEIGVELADGTPKKMTLNSTSYKALSGKWGYDTVSWINKVAKVNISRLPSGKNGMFLEALDE
jgi:hypothetical protein